MLYFDHNATAPMLREARQAWLDAAEAFIGNPSSPHRIGSRADTALTAAREFLGTVLGCDPFDIVWTSSATESANMVLHHFAKTLSADAEVWVSAIEHPCVLEATKRYFSKSHRLIPAQRTGVIDLDWLRKELRRRRPGLVAVMAANNETGVLQPWREVMELCRGIGVPFFCDAVQWIGKLPSRGLGECDFVSGCGHKFGGPKGVGFLKCPSGVPIEPLLYGGEQEEGRRAGTENVPGILSMTAALEIRESALAMGEHEKRGPWRDEFIRKMMTLLPGAEIVGTDQPCLWNTVSALMPEADCQQRWVVKLDKGGFAVSTGSACASGREEPSHVLAAMGYSAAESSRVLRFSSGWETEPAEWSRLLDGLVQVNQGRQETRKSEIRTL